MVSARMKSSPFEKHFRHYRHCYIAGAGDQHFHIVRSAIAKALEAKYPARARADDEPMPRPKRRGPIRKIHRASGVVDIYDDRDDGGTGQEDDEADA